MAANGLLADGGFEAVFFDLDGTLVDTAPDMVDVLLRMQDRHRQDPSSFELARNQVSNGTAGLLRLGFPNADEDELQALNVEFLDNYSNALCIRSDLFPPLRELLDTLQKQELPWGIVTNKPERMTKPLLQQLGIADDACCTVSGDTLTERKPHPEPLLHAARLAGVPPGKCVYVGDAARDIEAGKAAGMATIAVGYGYITPDDDPGIWGADGFVADTMALVKLLLRAVNLEN